jgi:hypothetical protein
MSVYDSLDNAISSLTTAFPQYSSELAKDKQTVAQDKATMATKSVNEMSMPNLTTIDYVFIVLGIIVIIIIAYEVK